MAFLTSDPDVFAAVQSIQIDEQAHESHATLQVGEPSGPYAMLWRLVTGATAFAIWLSTRL